MAKNNLQDVAAERAALSILCQSGSEYYFDVNDILTEETFTVDSNVVLYKCIKQIFQDSTSNKIDIGTILSAAATIGLTNFFDNKTEMQHIKAIMDFPADKSNLKSFVSKLKKLEIASKPPISLINIWRSKWCVHDHQDLGDHVPTPSLTSGCLHRFFS